MTLPHTATIKRPTKQGNQYTYSTYGVTKCFLQPLDTESLQEYGITFSKGSTMYVPFSTDIDENDRVLIDGIAYGVKGVRKHNYGNLSHKRVALEEV